MTAKITCTRAQTYRPYTVHTHTNKNTSTSLNGKLIVILHFHSANMVGMGKGEHVAGEGMDAKTIRVRKCAMNNFLQH